MVSQGTPRAPQRALIQIGRCAGRSVAWARLQHPHSVRSTPTAGLPPPAEPWSVREHPGHPSGHRPRSGAVGAHLTQKHDVNGIQRRRCAGSTTAGGMSRPSWARMGTDCGDVRSGNNRSARIGQRIGWASNPAPQHHSATCHRRKPRTRPPARIGQERPATIDRPRPAERPANRLAERPGNRPAERPANRPAPVERPAPTGTDRATGTGQPTGTGRATGADQHRPAPTGTGRATGHHRATGHRRATRSPECSEHLQYRVTLSS